MTIHPVILCGGSGTRLWPLSRTALPKQFLPILDGQSPFQATLQRLAGIEGMHAPVVVANQDHRFLVEEQLQSAGLAGGDSMICLEPEGRNTAPAAAVIANVLVRKDRDAMMLVLPADHDITGMEDFRKAVTDGVPAAMAGRLVVFGIAPRWPETGYGYIERGDRITAGGGGGNMDAVATACHQVASFIEKPELEIATRLVASGRHLWNSGMFLFSAEAFLEELRRLQPDLADAAQAAAAALSCEHGCHRLDPTLFARCAALSIDYAVMEHTTRAAVVEAGFGWSDIGSWNALWERAEKDASGNAVSGDVHLHGVSGSYLASHRRMVVGIGLKDVVVVETADAVLVADRGSVQSVREIVEHLRAVGRPEHQVHQRVKRPWGCYEDVDAGDRFRVKRIIVEPGAKLSLQMHHHRAEHWVVVSGTARVTRGEEVLVLTENQSTYIPLGMLHRLENPGRIPLQIIEVQSGTYLGEDDIVRIEDVYHRA